MTKEEIKLLLSIIFFVITLVFLIVVLIFIKKRNKYFSDVLKDIEEKTKDYFMNIEIEDCNLFPYHNNVVAGIGTKLSSKGEFDDLTKIKLKKHYNFFHQKIIYIVNNTLSYKFDIVLKNDKEYIVIDKKIKTIEILVSNNKPSHYMLKYEFMHDSDNVRYEVKEVTYDE